MSTTDLKTRGVSVPFNPTAISNYAMIYYGTLGIRAQQVFTLPDNMNITELYATIKLLVPVGQTVSFRVAIGKLNADYTINDTLTDAEILRSHRLITGLNAPFSGASGETKVIDGLNLVKALAGYAKVDAFCLYIKFYGAPVFVAQSDLDIKLFGSAMLGVL